MNALGVLSCLSLLLAAVAGQDPKPCVAPPLMNGGLTVMTADSFMTTGTVSYDAIGKRVRVRTIGLTANQTGVDQLVLFNKVFMGSSSSWGMGVLVNTWYGNLPGNGTYTTVFSEIGCIPMTFTSYTPATGWITVSTFNWVLGNSNPMDFHPPFFCAKAALEETETPHNMFDALKSLALRNKMEE
ncbi:ependymin-like [Xyrichtys novacula]|uniref:Ependymin-like n=1 Tax=Xyrichtys novacula TaxID=13765 RepID=A0AAV1EX42_XYRNO|nr:ependymin-like [Xyrichtys novacula]